MTLPLNDDIANRELSIEELDAIAAAGFWGNFWNGITFDLKIAGGPIVARLAAGDARTGTGGGPVGGHAPRRLF
jgi:hypothetical protein